MSEARSLGHSAALLSIEVTSRCNRACAYCQNPWKAAPDYPEDVELSADERLALVRRVLLESGLRRVEISGGEPLLADGVFELIEAIGGLGARVSMVTDGGLVDASVARRLAELRVAPAQTTLLAARPEVHDALKGVASFHQTIRGIGHLRSAGVPVAVSFICTRSNHREFRGVVELCLAMGVRSLAFNRCVAGAATGRSDDLLPTRDMISACLEVAEEANKQLGMRIQAAIGLPLCAFDPSAFPHVLFGSCGQSGGAPGYTVDPAGNLRPCGTSAKVLGNLVEEPWAAVVERAEAGYFAELRQPPEACRDCHLLARCGGGCRQSALACSGDARLPDPLAAGAAAIPDRPAR